MKHTREQHSAQSNALKTKKKQKEEEEEKN